ncbi:MAG: hypothetical protein SNJ56_04925 [Termitinemataceae bacterium]
MNQPSNDAVHILLAIVPIVGIVMGSIVAFLYLLWHHKRTVMLIQLGQYEKPRFDLLSFSLLTGLLLLCLGIVLTVVFVLVDGMGYHVLGGLIPLSLGIGLIAYFLVQRGDEAP